MERDFMGLNSKDSVVVVKQEVDDRGYKDSGSARSSEVPWTLVAAQDETQSKNFGGATIKQQYPPHSILPSTTKQWINSEASGFPAQLTIFYAGTVNVFDSISPEKAQAIMFLAGNGCIASNMAQPNKVHVQAPSSGLPSPPMSVSSHPIDEGVKVSKTVGTSTTIVNKVEPQMMISLLASAAATAMISSAVVPQARKASLARFLEKRKERAMHATPYNLGKKAADCATPESNDFGFSATSGVGSNSVSTSKEVSGGS